MPNIPAATLLFFRKSIALFIRPLDSFVTLGITAKEAENGIEAFRSGGINQAQGLVTQINSSRNIT